jgi:hypothetical protein
VQVYTHAVAAEVAQLLQQARSTAFGTILLKRKEREELAAGAAFSADVAVKGSSAAAVVASALLRVPSALRQSSALALQAALCLKLRVRDAVRARADAGHCALHHGSHVRRPRSCSID